MSETKAGDRYVVGFMFNPTEDAVLLIRKTHPNWQKGKLNGVGGRIDEGESALDAMRREFLEEVGFEHMNWQQFCVLGDARNWQIHFFWTLGPIGKAIALTDESPEIHGAWSLPLDTIPNLKWLIPMALSMKFETITHFDIREVKTTTEEN